MRIKLESAITAALVICAVVTTGIALHREFIAPGVIRQPERKPVLIRDWQIMFGRGVRIGPADAPVQIAEFADFECPYCGDFHNELNAVQEKHPGRIALTYIHFPIQGHRFAIPAARAAECANDQGRFEAMHDQLYRGQDQFGLKPWNDYATAAGVANLAVFGACVKRTDPIPRVEEGKVLGAKLDVQGTPTIIINGWKLGRPPTEAELDQMVQRILAGKSPVDGKS